MGITPQIPVSTVSDVRDYLLEQLQIEFGADLDTAVYYDEPGPGYPDVCIWLGEVEQDYDMEQMVGSGGAGWLYEHYTQVVEVSYFRGGDDPQGTFQACKKVVDRIERLVRSDPSFDGLVLVAYPAGTKYDPGWEDEGKGRVVDATLRIKVEAQR